MRRSNLVLFVAVTLRSCTSFELPAFFTDVVSDRRMALVSIPKGFAGVAAIILSTPTNVVLALDGDNNKKDDEDGAPPSLYLAQPLGASGEASSRPSAPLPYLLPASRVGLYIYQALAVAEDMAKQQQQQQQQQRQSITIENNAERQKMEENIATLDKLFLSPPNFIKESDPRPTRGDPYNNSPPIVGEIGAAARKQKERRDRSIDVGLAPQFFELGELVGERRQWNQLQKAERARESTSEVRRAFNIYTTNLNFNRNKYEWKGSKEEKSQRIRGERLPTTNDVIRSDLDARDLYRNQVQTALEDARAEYLYQKTTSDGDVSKFDIGELLSLLQQAEVAVNRWFSFVPDDDVKSALEMIRKEQTS